MHSASQGIYNHRVQSNKTTIPIKLTISSDPKFYDDGRERKIRSVPRLHRP